MKKQILLFSILISVIFSLMQVSADTGNITGFYDDFEKDLSAWTLPEKGSATIENDIDGNALLMQAPISGADTMQGTSEVKTGNMQWDNYIVTAKVKAERADLCGILVRYQKGATADEDTFYNIQYAKNKGIYLLKNKRNTRTNLSLVNDELIWGELPVDFQKTGWNDWKISVKDNTISVSINNKKIFDYIDESSPNLTGEIGLNTAFGWYSTSKTRFDDVKVTLYNPAIENADFSDDFSVELSKWNPETQSTVYETVKDESGKNALKLTGTITGGDSRWKDFLYYAEFPKSANLSFILRYQNTNNIERYYAVNILDDVLTLTRDGKNINLASSAIIQNSYNTITVKMIGRVVKVRLNGEDVITYIDKENPPSMGKIGIRSDNAALVNLVAITLTSEGTSFLESFDDANITQWELANPKGSFSRGKAATQEVVNHNGNNVLEMKNSTVNDAGGLGHNAWLGGDWDMKNYTFHAHIQTNRPYEFNYLLFRADNDGNYYILSFGDDADGHYMFLGKNKPLYDAQTALGKKTAPGVSYEEGFDVKIVVTGNHIRVYINNSINPIYDVTDENNPIMQGKIGIGMATGWISPKDPACTWFDNISVEQANNPFENATAKNAKEMEIKLFNPKGIWRGTKGISLKYGSEIDESIIPKIKIIQKDSLVPMNYTIAEQNSKQTVIYLTEYLNPETEFLITVDEILYNNCVYEREIGPYSFTVQKDTVKIDSVAMEKTNVGLHVSGNYESSTQMGESVIVIAIYHENQMVGVKAISNLKDRGTFNVDFNTLPVGEYRAIVYCWNSITQRSAISEMVFADYTYGGTIK